MGFAAFLAVALIVIIPVWYFWPKVDVKIDTSEGTDNEKNIGSIRGSATNSQNNNQTHNNFAGDFILTILIFILLLTQSTFQSFFLYRFMRRSTGTKAVQDHPPSTPPPSPKIPQSQQGTFSHSQAKLTSVSPPPSSPQNVYYSVSEAPQLQLQYSQHQLTSVPPPPSSHIYGPVQTQTPLPQYGPPQIQITEKQTQEDKDYKSLYNNLKIRSSAAGLEFKD